MNMNTNNEKKNTIPATIGLRLRKLRTDMGMTQESLALDLFEAGCNVGSSDICKYEGDKCLPKTEVVCRLCKIFDVSADYILFGNQNIFRTPRMTATMEASILALADEIRACCSSK